MRLARVSIEGYRSIRERLEVTFDPRVTVLLGANDHGKTNLLAALRHLNANVPFHPEDLNWDMAERADEMPTVHYELDLDGNDVDALARMDAGERLLGAAQEAQAERAEHSSKIQIELTEREGEASEVVTRLEDVAVRANEARVTLEEDPQNEELRDAAVREAAAVSALEEERRAAQKKIDDKGQELAEAGLAVAVAEARMIEGEALRDGNDVERAVTERADTTEASHQASSRNLKKAITKHRTLRAALDDLPDEADEADRQHAEQAVETAEKDLSEAHREAESKRITAQRLRAAAEAVVLLTEGDPAAQAVDLPVDKLMLRRMPPSKIAVERTGLKGVLTPEMPENVEPNALHRFLEVEMPQVVLVSPIDKLPDDVSLNQLPDEKSTFMRGVFLYAGLTPDEWDGIFVQDPRSSMRLQKASEQLNDTLRASWSQGRELTFRLQHDSKRGRITLEIMDPAVQSTFTKPSRRSSGFTHFFALKTILHALQSESRKSSYIWVFDEPGIHLHPDGQRDLIQVMETLSESNQVIYTTHSIFLANQNYPTRHRLLMRANRGTVLDSKPFLSRWRTALDALGLSLSGTVLFAPSVLLTEGDSDAIYITALLRKMIAQEWINIDLNGFAAIATGDGATAATLIRMLTEGEPGGAVPHLAVLVDGDGGGKERLRMIKQLAQDLDIPNKTLTLDTTLEDHLLGGPELYFQAVRDYLVQMADLDEPSARKLQASFEERFSSDELPKGLCTWTRNEAAGIAGLDGKPSAIGIARAYAALLEDAEVPQNQRTRALASWITDALSLPGQTLDQENILAP